MVLSTLYSQNSPLYNFQVKLQKKTTNLMQHNVKQYTKGLVLEIDHVWCNRKRKAKNWSSSTKVPFVRVVVSARIIKQKQTYTQKQKQKQQGTSPCITRREDVQPIPLVVTFSKAVSKLKAQSSNGSFHWNVAKETFELWALRFRKWHPKWDWLYIFTPCDAGRSALWPNFTANFKCFVKGSSGPGVRDRFLGPKWLIGCSPSA